MSQAVEGLQGASGSEALIQDEIHHLFDYVMVFKLNKGKQSGISKHCITRMLEAGKLLVLDCLKMMGGIAIGLDIYPYLSIQKDELIVLIGCPVSPLTLMHCDCCIDIRSLLSGPYSTGIR